MRVLIEKFNVLKKKKEKLDEQDQFVKYYADLTPKSDIEQGSYISALTWALDNKEINNVAITGPYGSGKSSILKSFMTKTKNDYDFLNISLASFQLKPDANENNLEKSIVK